MAADLIRSKSVSIMFGHRNRNLRTPCAPKSEKPTDYWINGLDGVPFFVLTQPVNPGLIAVLRQSIVPRLLAQAPQPDVKDELLRVAQEFGLEGLVAKGKSSVYESG